MNAHTHAVRIEGGRAGRFSEFWEAADRSLPLPFFARIPPVESD